MRLPEAVVRGAGRVMNALGVPGLVRTTDYRSRAFGTRVQVRCSGFFTVVSVNGLDVYFERLTGRIDGVGLTQAADYKSSARIPRSAHSGERHEHLPDSIQSQKSAVPRE